VYVSQDGENLMWLADEPTGTSSLDLKSFQLNAGNYSVFVQAVGKPSLANKMSAGAAMTIQNQAPVAVLSVSPTGGYGPLTVAASTAGSYDPDGSLSGSAINFGDGTTVSGTAANHTYAAAGNYTVIATVTDNLGNSSSASAIVTVKAPEVIISSPANGVSLSSPVQIIASGFSGLPVISMQIYVDGKLNFAVASANLDTSVTMSSGNHLLTVQGLDSSNRSFAKSLSLAIVGNQPPKAVISVSSSSVLVGGSITASTAGSSDPDGSIASIQIDFGDGTIVSGVSATHQYRTTGTFTVKATVTDNQGASSAASTTVVVKPRFVLITSPTAGTVATSSVGVIGTANSGYRVVATQVYLDGVLKYQSSTNHVNVSLTLSRGAHLICIQGWDESGATFKGFVTVTR
ncbi:MAG TPA: PKD domain-containing protein, partial [Candidatus Angelobacter sp.]